MTPVYLQNSWGHRVYGNDYIHLILTTGASKYGLVKINNSLYYQGELS